MVEGQFTVDDGVTLANRVWPVSDDVAEKGKIVFLHDLAEYTGCYEDFFPDFTAKGYEVISYDQRGSGKSVKPGQLAGVTNEHYVFDDLNRIIDQLLKKYKTDDGSYTGKLFLMGHGMGGAIVANYAVKGKYRERFDGYIAASTWVTLGADVFSTWTLRVMLPVMSRIKPKTQFTKKFQWDKLTDDEERIMKMKKDAGIRHTFSAGQIDACFERAQRLLSSIFVAKTVDRPLLVIHGLNDSMCLYDGAKQYYETLKIENKKLISIADGLHQLYNQLPEKREKYRDDVLDWLNEHSEGHSKYKDFDNSAVTDVTSIVSDAVPANAATSAAPDTVAANTATSAASDTVPATHSEAETSKVEETKEKSASVDPDSKKAVDEGGPTVTSESAESIEAPVKEEIAEKELPIYETKQTVINGKPESEKAETKAEKEDTETREKKEPEKVITGTKAVETVETPAFVSNIIEAEKPLEEKVAELSKQVNEVDATNELKERAEGSASTQKDDLKESQPETIAPHEPKIEKTTTTNETHEHLSEEPTAERDTSLSNEDTVEKEDEKESKPESTSNNAPKTSTDNKKKNKSKNKKKKGGKR